MQPVVRTAQEALAVEHLDDLKKSALDLGVSAWVLQVVQLGCEVLETVFPARKQFGGSFRWVLLLLAVGSIRDRKVILETVGSESQEIFILFKCAYLLALENKVFDREDGLLKEAHGSGLHQ